jgi:hypothetical protein
VIRLSRWSPHAVRLRQRRWRVTSDEPALAYERRDLGAAGYTAFKMLDNGLEGVRVFDPAGAEVSRDAWMAAFRERE